MNSKMATNELRNYENWVNWIPVKKDGGIKKVPINAKTGKNASISDRSTWSSYDEVIKHSDNIGFVFSDDLPFVGVDIDHCVDEKSNLNALGAQVVNTLDSYTEYSPSGQGLHIIVKCTDKSFIRKHKNSKGEIYGSGRYFTFTGNVFGHEKPIAERTNELKKVYELIFGDCKDDDAIIAKLCAIPKYARLFEGDTSEYAYEGEDGSFNEGRTEADLALASKLIELTDNCPEQVARIMDSSGLHRNKYNEPHYSNGETYLEHTIKVAAANRFSPTNEHPHRVNKKKKTLYTADIREALSENGLGCCLNVITGQTEITGEYPKSTPYLDPLYFSLRGQDRKQAAVDNLPAFIHQLMHAKNYSFTMPYIDMLITAMVSANRKNPIRDILTGGEWDKKDRITALYDFLGIENNELYKTYLYKWLLQSVAMGLNPEGEHTNEFALTLQGAQGIGKTEFFRILSMSQDFFTGGVTVNAGNRDSEMIATGAWIVELGEVDATFRYEKSELKNFLTSPYSSYRKPYAKTYGKYTRHTSFASTVNPEQFIKGAEGGSRRWGVIHLTKKIQHDEMRKLPNEWYVQLWRQVYSIFDAIPDDEKRASYRLSDEERIAQERENRNYEVPLSGEQEILELLDFSSPIEKWRYLNASELKEDFYPSSALNRFSASQIGKALKRISECDSRVIHKKVGNKHYYLLPHRKGSPEIAIEELLSE